MLEGMYSAAAGMAAQQQRLDAVSNDIANANTTGYKRVRVALPRPPLHARVGRRAEGRHRGRRRAGDHRRPRLRTGRVPAHRRAARRRPPGPGLPPGERASGKHALTRDGDFRFDDNGPPRQRAAATSSSRRSHSPPAATSATSRSPRTAASRSTARRSASSRSSPSPPAGRPAAARRQRLRRDRRERRASARPTPPRTLEQGVLESPTSTWATR